MTIADTFALTRFGGLHVAPDLPWPTAPLPSRKPRVRVELLDGSTLEVDARLETPHFKPGGFKLILVLPLELNGRVGPGSRIWADVELCDALGPGNASSQQADDLMGD
jgi:hypothetical protein